VPAHNALAMKQFLADKCIPVLQHPLWLSPVPKVKSALKGTHFQSVDEVNSKTVDLLNRVSADDLQHCFEQWKIRVQQCIDGGGRVHWRGKKLICKIMKIHPIFHTSPVIL
jgi:hypothetical protein